MVFGMVAFAEALVKVPPIFDQAKMGEVVVELPLSLVVPLAQSVVSFPAETFGRLFTVKVTVASL